ncbi:HNH endonuclease [Mycobacteroides abscessus]|uniref:HNH endonuclease n=1 Tax=Mycobacteroides abscessus TaxID=36809 RepID=UPI0019D25B4E|nr:HNH endonuclease [Mycobacteroides abscessus]MBN7452622.1 HNH endonuclease [Mycobacteroides abscessus subsp. abscessus]
MLSKPCIKCGEPAPGTYCSGCRPADTRIRNRRGQAAYDPHWRKLSQRARKLQPWCLDCGAVDDLTADHIIPKSVAPELVHVAANVAVRCRPCNSRRGATTFTQADAQAVLERLEDDYRRRPTKSGRDRLNVAQRAALTRGDTPNGPSGTPGARRRGQ